jgi:hypothetical protein
MFLLYFGTQYLSFLDVVQIDNGVTGVCLVIMMACAVVSGIFNLLIEKMRFHEDSTKRAKTMENRS